MRLQALDHDILNILQQEFPLNPQPFKTIAEQLGITENEVLKRIQLMKDSGIIRRIGGVIDSPKMGFYSTLCACRVAEEKVEEIAGIINDEPGVTHNYIRDHDYNLWFTLTAPSYESANTIIEKMERNTGIKIISMPAKYVYKIKAVLNVGEKNEPY